MSSVANRKFTDMRQIEFQQSGSSSISAMLVQPLLEKSSTYMCEVTDLQCTLGEELAFPRDEWLFTIMRRPRASTIEPLADKNWLVSMKELQNMVMDKPTDPEHLFGMLVRENGESVWKPVALDAQGNETPINIGFQSIRSEEYYSVMDFVYGIAMQVKQFDRQEFGNTQHPVVMWESAPEEGHHMISVTFDAGGHMRFNMTQEFMSEYMILTSPLFRAATGFPVFIGEYNAASGLVDTLDDFGNAHARLDAYSLLQYSPSFGNDLQVAYNTIEALEAAMETDFYVMTPVTAPAPPAGMVSTSVRDIVPLQEGIDIRKRIVLEVSLPISHTLAWNGERESTRFVLQEFVLPSPKIDLGFECGANYADSRIRFRSTSNMGQIVMLNGGSNLAIKKLNEGQMQAFRVNLLLEYKRWNVLENKFELARKNVEIGDGGFIYIKLLFTKETI